MHAVLGMRLLVTFAVLVLLCFSFCADVLAFTNAYFGEHSSPGTNLTNVYCHGDESRLIDCTHSLITYCGVSQVAGVRCQGKTVAGMYVMCVCSLDFP